MNLPEELDLLLDELIQEETLSTDDENVLKQIATEYRLDYNALRNELADRGGPEAPFETDDHDSDAQENSIVAVLGALLFLLAAIVGSIWLVGASVVKLFRTIFG